jgi:hypothetical protein
MGGITASLIVTLTVIAAGGLLGTHAEAHQNSKPNLGSLTWEAFECATFSELAGDKELPGSKDEQRRLFDLGYLAGTKFLNRVKNHTADTSKAPVVVLLTLEGPTNDFIIGRLFEAASTDAFNKVKNDNAGVPLQGPEIDDQIRALDAGKRYRQANCQLLSLPPN